MKRFCTFAFAVLTSLVAAQDPIIGAPVRVSVDNQCNSASETTGAATTDGLEILAGFVDFRPDGTFKNSFAVTSNGGQTWSHIVLRPPFAYQATVEADPMTAFDPRTNTLFAGGISAAKCIYVAKKTPGQNSFGPSLIARIASWPDKGWMAAGPRPGLPDTTRLYITYNEGIIWSDDMGITWVPPLSLGQGYGFLPRVGPDGVLYLTYWDGYWGIKFTKSLDGGQTWSAPVQPATRLVSWGVENYGIPGLFRDFTSNAMAINPINGEVVIMWFDQTNIVNGQKNLDLYMVRSSDGGASWTDGERLPFRPLNQVSDMIFPWIEFTKDGRLHLFAMDTSYNLGQTDGATHGWWDQVYCYSDDSGVTWSQRFRLTPVSWDSYYDGTGYKFLGDYQGMAVAGKSVFPVYPDTHTGSAEAYVNRIYDPVERPTTFRITGGSYRTDATVAALYRKDGTTLNARPLFPGLSGAGPPLIIEMTAKGLSLINPSALSISTTSWAGPGSAVQQISVFNVQTLSWDLVDTRALGQTATTVTISLNSPTSYISPSTGTARWRVAYRPPLGQEFGASWSASLDQTVLLVVP